MKDNTAVDLNFQRVLLDGTDFDTLFALDQIMILCLLWIKS